MKEAPELPPGPSNFANQKTIHLSLDEQPALFQDFVRKQKTMIPLGEWLPDRGVVFFELDEDAFVDSDERMAFDPVFRPAAYSIQGEWILSVSDSTPKDIAAHVLDHLVGVQIVLHKDTKDSAAK